ncbi:hypothetical protein PHMEG_00032859 [Phytophthora megakarya]|uniref:Uncharacterized protein n=1 Tax=Phytophthora megakarya TaxID=4795 RepID=A0A225UW73_9STRA|nr:hypothetical protein PHMEG_00032859 [Phytophthora megakarya]
MKVDEYDKETTAEVDLAVGTVTFGSRPTTEREDEMQADMTEREEKRAALYVATVHPAMASARLSREYREEEQRQLERQVQELARTGEDLETGEGDTVSHETNNRDEDSGTLVANGEVADSVENNKTFHAAVDVNYGGNSDATSSAEAAKASASGQTETSSSSPTREVKETRRATRKRDATEALKKLYEQQDHHGTDKAPRTAVELESARVSLVQRRSDTAGERGIDETVQCVGPEARLPTACMTIDGELKLIKLDSFARY